MRRENAEKNPQATDETDLPLLRLCGGLDALDELNTLCVRTPGKGRACEAERGGELNGKLVEDTRELYEKFNQNLGKIMENRSNLDVLHARRHEIDMAIRRLNEENARLSASCGNPDDHFTAWVNESGKLNEPTPLRRTKILGVYTSWGPTRQNE